MDGHGPERSHHEDDLILDLEDRPTIPVPKRGPEKPPERPADRVKEHITVVDKVNLSNPFHKRFSAPYERPKERGSKPLPTISEQEYERMMATPAHTERRSTIAAADFVGYVEVDGKKRFVDVVSAVGLGQHAPDREAGEVMMVSYAKDGLRPNAPEDVARYELLVTFPESEHDGVHSGGLTAHEFPLDDVDMRGPDARGEAKALFDAVAQYVDDGYDEDHLRLFVREVNTMLRRRIYQKEPQYDVEPLKRIVGDAVRAANQKRRVSEREQIRAIKESIQERNATPREPRENGNEAALAIVTGQLMAAERKLALNPDDGVLSAEVATLREEKADIEDLIDGQARQEAEEMGERKRLYPPRADERKT